MTFADVVGSLIDLINKIIPVLSALAVVLFMLSGYQYVRKSGGSKGQAGAREALVWGGIALIVLFSIWGILRLLKETLL